MSGDYAEWSAADLYYRTFYEMEAAYQMAMAQQPPNVILAFRVLRQLFDRVACFLSPSTVDELDAQMAELTSLLYDLDDSTYSWVPAVKARIAEKRQEAIGRLSKAQRLLYSAMNDKKMLVPMGRTTTPGYGQIGPGGVSR